MELRPSLASSVEWEAELGSQVRRLRLRQNRTQSELAIAANISLSALKTLELGRGSSVRTLIQVARALDRSEWLSAFSPPEPRVSPMQMLRAQQKQVAAIRKRANPKARR
jgi:transcriptional regulator with XRE-family HTH domain